MNKSLATIKNVVLLILAFVLPLTLLPLRAPYGFERNIILIVLFLALASLKIVTAYYNSNNRSYTNYKIYTAATALLLAAFLSAQGEARWANLTNLSLWASVAGIAVSFVAAPLVGAPKKWRGQAPQLLLAAGTAVAVIGLISPMGPIQSRPLPGLDYPTSLTITSKTLQNSPLWGVGPGRFSEAFMLHKDAGFNQRPDWSLRYGLSQSGFLQFATEYGFLGILAALVLLWPSVANLNRSRQELSKKSFGMTALPALVLLAAFLLLPYSPGVFWVMSYLNSKILEIGAQATR